MAGPRYQIESSLGGGMSEVFLGRDLHTGQQVVIKAMKVIQDAEVDQQAHIRFTRETEIALSTVHPHILQAIGYGTMERKGHVVPFLVYPYIKDGTLHKLMRETRPWTHWELLPIVDVIKQAAQGLYFLHSLEIVHQDVKPDNFLHRIEQEQRADHLVHIWLNDFGIARRQVAPNHQTSNIVGTPGYMAPEQLWGFIEPTTDQFALALVARYLLTGCSPYAEVGPRSIRTPITELNAERLWSREIDEVMLKALAKESDKRFPTVLAFAEALHQAITNQVSPHFYSASTEQFRPVAPTAINRPRPLQAELVFPEISITPIRKHEPVDEPLPEPPAKPVSTLPRFLELFPLSDPFVQDFPAKPSMFSWSPDGDYLLCTFYEQEPPRLVSLSGKPEVVSLPGYGHLGCWSPDASRLAISRHSREQLRSEIRLWQRNAPSEPLVTLFSAEESTRAIEGLDWSRHGQIALWVEEQILLYSSLPTDLAQRPLTPQLLTTQNGSCGNIGTLRWSPDGLFLAAGASNGRLACWRADKGRQLRQAWYESACGVRIYSLGWSADSTVLAVAFADKRVELWDVHAGRRLKVWKLPKMPQMVSISGQDNTMVIATKQGLFFGRLDEDGPAAKHPGQLLAAWSPVGRELATLDGQGDTRLVVWQS